MSPQKKKIKTRTPRPKPRPLKLKQAKLKQSDPRQRYLPSYEIELERKSRKTLPVPSKPC
ncbi:hypothetical protein F441_22957 [Phytophthora nicotianae CJ01A1]|uniref:Uncharacterized protein n=1 Tax=Phytophthora nicotianae CJ01A1 TaxID=1317063 RepID=W2VPN0_PHYNI|nr:hypothetical protein F441_22957 [Phytophthora nicotianae CJ01A1]